MPALAFVTALQELPRRGAKCDRSCAYSAGLLLRRAGGQEEHGSQGRGSKDKRRWQDQVYDLLRQHNVTQFAYVPDAGHSILIDRSLADPDVHSVALTTEEEGVALLAGRRSRRRARRAADAEQRRRQLHQHAVADAAAGAFRSWR